MEVKYDKEKDEYCFLLPVLIIVRSKPFKSGALKPRNAADIITPVPTLRRLPDKNRGLIRKRFRSIYPS
jgi:hypothetical protein